MIAPAGAWRWHPVTCTCRRGFCSWFAAPWNCGIVRVSKGADCLIADRLRVRDDTGQGVSLEPSRLPWRGKLEGVPEHGLLNGSLNATLKARGLTVQSGVQWANVLVELSAPDAKLMARSPGEPMLRLRRLTRAADHTVIEYVESILDPDLFGLHIEF